jgi:serine/threonine-protein kinase
MLLGSPLYMAPEQMRSSKYADARSDIWSLGAVAYEVLTGRLPFEGKTLLDLCFRVAQEDCEPPRARRPEIPAALSAAIMRCLEKAPEKRYRSVGELAAALEPFAPREVKDTAKRIEARFSPASASRLRAPLTIGALGIAVLALSYALTRSGFFFAWLGRGG